MENKINVIENNSVFTIFRTCNLFMAVLLEDVFAFASKCVNLTFVSAIDSKGFPQFVKWSAGIQARS